MNPTIPSAKLDRRTVLTLLPALGIVAGAFVAARRRLRPRRRSAVVE